MPEKVYQWCGIKVQLNKNEAKVNIKLWFSVHAKGSLSHQCCLEFNAHAWRSFMTCHVKNATGCLLWFSTK